MPDRVAAVDTSDPNNETVCFQQWMVLDCPTLECTNKTRGLRRAQVMDLVTRGRTTCRNCGRQGSPYDMIREFPNFGRPEALFGLTEWIATKTFPPSQEHRIVSWDIGVELPHEGHVLYANVTPTLHDDVDAANGAAPRMFALQNAHAQWPLQLGIYAPPSRKETKLNFLFVMAPKEPLDPPRDLAIQAVGMFHRQQYNMASIMLASAVEAALGIRLKREYKMRGVEFDDRSGVGTLLERARLVMEPAPGPNLVGELRGLFEARNRAAHGNVDSPEQTEVARWMVTTAIVIEWVRLADSVYDRASIDIGSNCETHPGRRPRGA